VKYNKDRRSEQREVMITCSCANMVCQAPVVVDGVHRAPASSRWYNDKNERVNSFPEGGNYIYSQCLRIPCECTNENCQATVDADGVHRAPASCAWFNDENKQVTSFPKGRKYTYGQCLRIPCACTNGNCQATVDADGVHREPASSHWYDDENERVSSFPKGGNYTYGQCLRIPCACTNVNCQATVDVDGVHRAPASCDWFNDENEQVTSFPKGRKYIYGGCIRTKKRKRTKKKKNTFRRSHVSKENWKHLGYPDIENEFYNVENRWCPLCNGRTIDEAEGFCGLIFFSSVDLWLKTKELLKIARDGIEVRKQDVHVFLSSYFKDNKFHAASGVADFDSFRCQRGEICYHCLVKAENHFKTELGLI